MPPIPQEVNQRARTKISALSSLVEGCPCRPEGCAPTGQWPVLPQASGLQDLWKRRTIPADPVWFWERTQCSLPLTLAPREAEEQAWATLGWLPNRPVIPAQLPRSQFPFPDSLSSHAPFFPNLNTTGSSGSCVHPQLLCPACQRTEVHHSVH